MIFLEEHCVLFFQSKWSKSNAKDRLKQASGKHEYSLIYNMQGTKNGMGEKEAQKAVSQAATSFFSV